MFPPDALPGARVWCGYRVSEAMSQHPDPAGHPVPDLVRDTMQKLEKPLCATCELGAISSLASVSSNNP
jgi:hypothetical protein